MQYTYVYVGTVEECLLLLLNVLLLIVITRASATKYVKILLKVYYCMVFGIFLYLLLNRIMNHTDVSKYRKPCRLLSSCT